MNRSYLLGLLCIAPLLFSSCGTEPINPARFTGAAAGCGSFFVYRFNPEKTEAIVVSARRDDLPGDDTLEVTLPSPHLDVRIDRFDKSADGYYCDDVMMSNEAEIEETWTAVSGRVGIVIDRGLQPPTDEFYDVTLRLDDVILENEDGERVTVDSVDMVSIFVGWYAG